MKRVAILADIHGNMPALRAVIDDLKAQAPDEVIVAGDLVGRGPQGTAVVREVLTRGWPCIRGNHEDYMISFRRGDIPEEWRHDEGWSAARWMAAEIAPDALAFIEALPFSISAPCAPQLRIVHGSPSSNTQGIGSWTSDDEMRQFLAQIEEHVLICAHTHRPLHRVFSEGMIVNVGSVGLPFNGDWRAQYAILTGQGEQWEVDFRCVPYDRDALFLIYEQSGFLAAGGVTAALLKKEAEHARSFLVPFLHWAEAKGLPLRHEPMQQFLAIFDPNLSIREFFAMIKEVKEQKEQEEQNA